MAKFTMALGPRPVRMAEGTGQPVHDGSSPKNGDIVHDRQGNTWEIQGDRAVQIGRKMPSEYYGTRHNPNRIFS